LQNATQSETSQGQTKSSNYAAGVATNAEIHASVANRLEQIGQRYTAGRRQLVTALHEAGKPLSLPEILDRLPGVPQSSAYRSLAVLTQAAALQKLASNDEFGRFELAEALTGHHHHHLSCHQCGVVRDIELSVSLENAFAAAQAELGLATGFRVTTHEVAFAGLCEACQAKQA
jgi:Fur family transcriptional regulator, ferric uptake regulator